MKLIFFFTTFISTLTLTAQNKIFIVTLRPWIEDSKQCPSRFDTIYLTSGNQIIKTYTEVIETNSIFKLTDVPIGKYRLKFVAPNYCVLPLTIVICSKCDSEFAFSSFISSSNCGFFELVEVSPSYSGGYKELSKDFQKNINEKETHQLKSTPNFTIQFFVTKQKTISDISFFPDNLPQKVKDIVIKGLTNIEKWNPAIRNGQVVDALFSIDKQTLFKN
jgi:hypothetical protein